MESTQTNSSVVGQRLKTTAYTIGTILFLFAGWVWYVNNHYSFVYDNNFKAACMAQGASEPSCGCALDRMKANYSFSTAKSIERTGVYPNALTSDIQNACS